MSFGNRLKNLRKEKNYSQEAFAKKIGVSRSSVGNYETNQNMPTTEILNKIADVLECSIDYLLEKTNKKSYDADEKLFRSLYYEETKGLTDQEISDALKFYKELRDKINRGEML